MAYGSLLADVVQGSTAGTPPQFNDGNGTQVGTLCRSWVSFVGNAVSIRGSFNVSSVTRVGTGNWQINTTTAMADTNYAVFYTPGNNSSSTYYTAAYPSTSSQAVVWNYNGASQIDTAVNSVAIFR